MRVVKMMLSLLALALAGTAMAGQLTPGLEAYLADRGDTGPIKALVILRDQVDVTGMDLDLHYQRADLAHRHFQVVTALREKAEDTQTALLADLESRKGSGIDGYTSYWLINAVVVTGTEEAIRAIAARDDVDVVEVDVVPELIEPIRSEVNDKSRSIGITPGLVNIGARRVWDELGIRGEGALIGSLDTGVDGSHPALASRWRGTHAPWNHCWLDVLGTSTQFPNDGNGHGTHTTGTMTGLAVNDTIGVAPAAEWIATNAINQGASSGFDSDILNCFQFFTDPDGNPATLDDVPDVVQNSWGVNESFGYPDCDSRWWTVIDACEAAGVVVTWSAGNEGPGSQTLRSPGDRATTLYNCFSVGATQHSSPYTIASFSSRGPAGPNCGPVENRVKPEISAPGVSIYSSYPGGGYTYMDGTSMAGPHVAGVVALMRSANPNADVITIKQVLMETANDLGTVGDDNIYGHGFLDAFEAVSAVMGGLGWVEGTVQDRFTGFPIANAVVTVEGGFQSVTTAADGFYRLTLPVGPATLSAEAFGYADLQVAVTINEDMTTYRDLSMSALPSATVSGTVYAAGQIPPGGTPAGGATVTVAGTPLAAVTTDAAGHFSIDVPVGADYVIQASKVGSGAIGQTVPVDGDVSVELYLSPFAQEGFETGNLSALPWTTGGNANWYVQTSYFHTGVYAARSGAIGNNQATQLQVTLNCGSGGLISFWYRVSSEEDYDYLEFAIDGALVQHWSGESGWALYSTNVAGGSHAFRWNYSKDVYVVDGSDAGFLDDITFPAGMRPTPMAVAMPWILEATLDPGQVVTLPLVVMNQGSPTLNFTATAGGFVNLANASGSIGSYGYQTVQAVFDTDGLMPGYHTTNITISSNDPDNPTLMVQARLHVTGETTPVGDAPQAFALVGAVPNPFNPQTTIQFTLPVEGHVDLHLYDVQGRLVRTLVSGVRPSGLNEARWDGRDDSGRAMASGTYFARLQSGDQRSVKSMVLVR